MPNVILNFGWSENYKLIPLNSIRSWNQLIVLYKFTKSSALHNNVLARIINSICFLLFS